MGQESIESSLECVLLPEYVLLGEHSANQFAVTLSRTCSLTRMQCLQESVARVKSLSLSGKLLYPIADKFMVQWPDLLAKYPRARYVGFVI